MNGMRRKCVNGALMVFALMLCMAAPAAAKTQVDFDPNMDFSKFKTWAFIGGVEQLVMMQLNPDLIKDRVHRAAARELSAKGLREVQPNENPDLVVRYWANSSTDLNVAAKWNFGIYDGFVSSDWTYWWQKMQATSTKEASLILDLIDPHSKKLAWRLYISMKVYNNDKAWKSADKDFTEGFKSFPPSPQEIADKRKEREEHPAPPASNS